MVLLLLIFGGGVVLLNRQTSPPKEEEDKVFCTQDVKECPDGSYVGRVAPKCEFTECSTVGKECGGRVTPQLTEGPYYKSGSPERTNIASGASGESLVVSGYVYDKNCKSISGAWLDFWQADGNGVYDNSGYRLRGHQYTDKDGKYVLETVVPGEYPGRTPHIHVKVRASKNSPLFTSQLFMPAEAQNQKDPIFNQALIMDVKDTPAGKVGTFNFVI